MNELDQVGPSSSTESSKWRHLDDLARQASPVRPRKENGSQQRDQYHTRLRMQVIFHLLLAICTIYIYNSVCARRHKHINSSASAKLNKLLWWRVATGGYGWWGQTFYFRSINVVLWRFFARSGSVKRVPTQLILPQRRVPKKPIYLWKRTA